MYDSSSESLDIIVKNKDINRKKYTFDKSVWEFEEALEEARAAGYLGDKILGNEFSFQLHATPGWGACAFSLRTRPPNAPTPITPPIADIARWMPTASAALRPIGS